MTLRLHFDDTLPHQTAAVEAACDLFRGQEACQTEFTVTRASKRALELPLDTSVLGMGNAIIVDEHTLMANLQEIQRRNGLPVDTALVSRNFTVEMETGTGKTYVYIKTIFELNRKYGLTKFIIVVPSVAIREGVYHTLRTTADHFRQKYAGVQPKSFVYDSKKLNEVRGFATDAGIQIMVVTVGSINKQDTNTLYRPGERTLDEAPIDLIRVARPILIVDEPQSVDGGLNGRGMQALEAMHPLCTLRYSATHANRHHMIYRLDAVDAYQRHLVKQIEVASIVADGDHNQAYVKLLETGIKRGGGTIQATIEIDALNKAGAVTRISKTVVVGADLEKIAKRDVYAGLLVGEITRTPGAESITLGTRTPLALGETIGSIDKEILARRLLRSTIEEHLKKEARLVPRGIKVLSLFFVDHVADYRTYGPSGEPQAGPYARIFEEEYTALTKQNPRALPASEVHNGYFSQDRRGTWTDTTETGNVAKAEAEAAYHLIMSDKEILLDMATPLRFIFSHSALREGWDNPNVFQICAMRDMGSLRQRRQTIGRGLRLAVNQNGDRVHDDEINILTVFATESYQQFAEGLQQEIEKDTGIRFNVLGIEQLLGLEPVGGGKALDEAAVVRLAGAMREAGYLDASNAVTQELHRALDAGALRLPDEFDLYRNSLIAAIQRTRAQVKVRDHKKQKAYTPRAEVIDSEAFRNLWERICYRTVYSVTVKDDDLVAAAQEDIRERPAIAAPVLRETRAVLSISHDAGVGSDALVTKREVAAPSAFDLPDAVTYLERQTGLTRSSLGRILTGSGRLRDFVINPQAFLDMAVNSINEVKRRLLARGVRYERMEDGESYVQEGFRPDEIVGYEDEVVQSGRAGLYDAVVVDDSQIERDFAKDLAERQDRVVVYTKLPRWFTIPTPLGDYNPDWALVVQNGDQERVYFVVETKGTTGTEGLRGLEADKIACGKKHFEALREDPAIPKPPARYQQATRLSEVLAARE